MPPPKKQPETLCSAELGELTLLVEDSKKLLNETRRLTDDLQDTIDRINKPPKARATQ
jgi:hypothetical protein